MGTTSEKLTYLNGTKQLLKDKINNLGGSIDDNTTFRQYANQLQNVYDNLPKTSFQEGTEVTIENGLKGKLDFDEGKVGFGQASQESTQGYNKLKLLATDIKTANSYYSGTWTGNKYVLNGVTFDMEVNSQGVVTKIKISGTSSAQTTFYLFNGNNYFTSGDYMLSGCTNGSNTTYDLRAYNINGGNEVKQNFTTPVSVTSNGGTQGVNVAIMVRASQTISNVEIAPMLEPGSTAHDWEQYTGGYASPSPNWEQPIQCVTGNQDVVVRGKNLFVPELETDNTTITQARCEVTLSGNEYTIIPSGADFNFGNTRGAGLAWAGSFGTLYDISKYSSLVLKLTNADLNKNFVTFYDSNKLSLGFSQINNSTGLITKPDNAKYCSFRIGRQSYTEGDVFKTYIQLEVGNQATTYEPYHTPITYPISLGSNKFYKIGDYEDELLYDVDEDKVYKNEKIGETIIDGSGLWWETTQGTHKRYYTELENGVSSTSIPCFANYFKGVSRDNLANNNECSAQQYANFVTDDFADLEAFQTWLSTHNVKLVRVLATPVETEITDTNLHNQVKMLYNAQSLNGTTIITSNGDLPMIIKVRALKGE